MASLVLALAARSASAAAIVSASAAFVVDHWEYTYAIDNTEGLFEIKGALWDGSPGYSIAGVTGLSSPFTCPFSVHNGSPGWFGWGCSFPSDAVIPIGDTATVVISSHNSPSSLAMTLYGVIPPNTYPRIDIPSIVGPQGTAPEPAGYAMLGDGLIVLML